MSKRAQRIRQYSTVGQRRIPSLEVFVKEEMRLAVHSRIAAHLSYLSQKVGPRLVGSEGHDMAAGYLKRTLTAAGYRVDTVAFACPRWRLHKTHLALGELKLACRANTFTSSCRITAPLVPVSTLATLASLDLSDKIAVLYGQLAQGPISRKGNPYYLLQLHKDIIAALEIARPAALITVNPQPGDTTPLIEDWEFAIPGVTVSPETARELLEADEEITLVIEAELERGEAAHLVARTERDPGHIVVCAHYDTKAYTPGALDNASGVALVVALAETFSEQAPGIDFVLFSGEEYGLGEPEYLSRAGDFAALELAVNIDGVGQALGATNFSAMSASTGFESLVKDLAREQDLVWIDPWPASNHYTFYTRGVPSLAVSSVGLSNVIHTPADTPALLDLRQLGEVAAFVQNVITGLSSKPAGWTRPGSVPTR